MHSIYVLALLALVSTPSEGPHAAPRSAAIPARPLRFEEKSLDATFPSKDWEGNPNVATLRLHWPAPSGGAPGVADSICAVIARCVIGGGPWSQGTTLDSLAARAVRAARSQEASEREVDRGMVVVLDSLGVVSLQGDEYVDSGGAHGQSSSTLYTLDRRTGRRLGLEDLLVPGSHDSLVALGERSFRRQWEVPEGKSLGDAGYTFGGPFRLGGQFMVVSDGLEFFYAEYEVASYAAGPAAFTIPWAELRTILRPDGPLGDLAR